jgi:serine/threonine-protein kinase
MKRFLKLIFYSFVFFIIGVLCAYLIYYIWIIKNTEEVPSLQGKTLTEASEILSAMGLRISIQQRQYSDQIEEGHIIFQDPLPGTRVEKGAEINVIVSLGPEIYSLPSFEGQLLEDARLTLKNLGIKIGKITWIHSDTVGKGRIIAQRPLPGNIQGNEINFLVSLGPYEVFYRCPSFINMTVEDARYLAEKLGIKLRERGSGSRIIFQRPEAGSKIKRGDTVEVKLGRGWGMWF